ncbi:MAG: tRNA pseudouridine(55) synthase TruB [Minisyncoccia bacterium]
MILLIDKPTGITSYDVIRKLKLVYPKQKIGHAGTLDPNASGLLIVGVGDDTKKLAQFLKLDKEYDAVVELGIKTDTGDIDGKIIQEMAVPEINEGQISKVLEHLLGENEYDLPVYSAIKSGGEPLYKKVRRGEKVVAPKRKMIVYSAKLIKYKKPYIKIKFFVGSGTYIRSLAEVIGQKLNTVATLKNLRRTKIGDYVVEKASVI